MNVRVIYRIGVVKYKGFLMENTLSVRDYSAAVLYKSLFLLDIKYKDISNKIISLFYYYYYYYYYYYCYCYYCYCCCCCC